MFDRLPIRYKMMIILKDHYGFSINEMAGILECSEQVVKVTLFRARKRLKEVYEEYERETLG